MNKYFMFRRVGRNGGNEDLEATPGRHGLILCRVGYHSDYPKAPFPMCFTREALCTLIDSVGVRPPETGAMGFSPADQMGFDLVEFSPGSSNGRSGVVYRPDEVWGAERQEFHLNQPLASMRAWSGDLHSHPGGCTHPSPRAGVGLGDLGYVEEVFAANEWMEWFFIPILTGAGTDEITIHPWVCRRGRPVELMIADLEVCSVSRFPKRVFNREWEQRAVREAEERERALREAETTHQDAAEDIPSETVAPPTGQPTKKNGEEPSAITQSVGERHHREHVPAGEYSVGAVTAPVKMPSGGTPHHEVVEVSPAASSYGTDFAGLKENDQHREAYTQRLKGIVSPAFQQKTILTVGAGAGSYAVEKLLRLCPKEARYCDFDHVEFPNLTRTVYTVQDARAKRLKVDALTIRAAEVNPWVRVRPYSTSFTRLSRFQMDEMFEGVDLVIGGTDSLEAQALVNEQSVMRGIPAVFIGIHAGAQGGRVIWSVPGETPCYRCVARDRFETSVQGQHQPVDLAAATGSILDCQFIDMLATKIAVAILERGQDSAMGRFFKKMGRRTDVVIRCDPDYEWGQALWNAVLGDLPKGPKDYARELGEQAFLAMDSIWLNTDYDPECPVCRGRKTDRKSDHATKA